MGGLIGIAPTAGFLLGGKLIELGNQVDWMGWRIIFLINIPLAAVIIPFAVRVLKETEPSPEGRDFDILGAVLLVAGLCCLMLGFNKGGEWGWTSTRILVAFAAAPVLLGLFVLRENRYVRPLISLDLFRYRSLTTANIAGFFITGGLFGSMLLLPFYFSTVLELSPFWVGLASAPVAITFALFSPVGGWLTSRIGSRTTLFIGLLTACGGYLLVSQVLSYDKPQTEAALIVAAAVGLVGVGIGLCWAPVDATAMHDVPGHKRGVAASLPNMSRFIGGSFAAAGITAVLSWRLTERLIGIGVPTAEAEEYSGVSAESLSITYKEASTQAYHDVFLITIIFIAGAMVAAAFMPQVYKGKE
jgi:EmrB/QacA subfamily drug resistance transporter